MTCRIHVYLVVALFAASRPPVLAEGGPGCSNADLKGRYGFTLSGHHVGIGKYALVGVFEVDGSESVKGTGMQSINGNHSRVSFSGTYAVEADCTGYSDLTFGSKKPAKMIFVIVGSGNEVLLMDVGGQTIETGYAKAMDAGFGARQSLNGHRRK